MGDVIEFKRKGDDERDRWLFDLRVFADHRGDWQGELLESSLDDLSLGDRMDAIAEALSALTFYARCHAFDAGSRRDGRPLFTITVWEGSRVTVRADAGALGPLSSRKARSWVRRRFDDACKTLRELCKAV